MIKIQIRRTFKKNSFPLCNVQLVIEGAFCTSIGLIWCTTNFFFLLQIFNGCPLKINCTASWIHPETRDQHILVGAEEGIYTLNLTELHENAMDLLYPRRTVWMFVIKDVLMTLSGKEIYVIAAGLGIYLYMRPFFQVKLPHCIGMTCLACTASKAIG